MADLLVRLYALPPAEPPLRELETRGILIRRAMAYEKQAVVRWVTATFGDRWGSECDVSFARQPIACFLATEDGRVAGFACYDVTARGFFGPIGVYETRRKLGIGRALLLTCLHAMAAQGFAYAVIGGGGGNAGDFYRRVVDALDIPGSTPGIYRDPLQSGS